MDTATHLSGLEIGLAQRWREAARCVRRRRSSDSATERRLR